MTHTVPIPEPLTLVEIDLDSGTRYYSFQGISLPDEGIWFKDSVTSIGTVYRESPLIAGRPRIADTTVKLFDPELLELKASEPFRGRTVRLRFGNIYNPAGITTLYTGYIIDYSTEQGAMTLTVRDTSFDILKEPLTGRLNKIDFPAIPSDDTLTILLPVVYGKLTSEGLWDTGAVPCYRINDSTPYQYLVARHPCKQILNVYNYESLMATSDWDARLKLVNGEYVQILEFATDPKAGEPYMTPGRPDEFEITADIEGKTDTGLTGGPLGGLIDTPAAQLRDYLLNYAGVAESQLSTAHWLAALTEAAQQHKATSFDGSTQYLTLAATSLLSAADSIFYNGVGNWAVDAGGTSAEWVNIADAGLHTTGLPDGIHTALKITVNGTDDDIAQVAVTLTALQYFASAYVLLGDAGWDGDDIRVYFSDFAGSSAGTAVDVTPATDVWQRASEDNTPVGGDLAGFLSVRALSGTPATSGQIFYLTCAQAVQEASLNAFQSGAVYSFGDQDFWVSIWGRADDLAGGAGDEQLLWRWQTSNFEWILYYYQAGGQFRFTVTDDGSTQQTVISAQTPANDTLYHFFAYHSATDGQTGISVNGETIVTATHTTGVFQGITKTALGGTNNQGTWDGELHTFKAGCAVVGWDITSVLPQTLGDTLYNSGVPLSYDEITTEQKESWGLVSGLNIYPDREANAFTDLHNGIAWTNNGSLTAGDSELTTGGEGLRSAAWIGGEETTHMDVVDKFSSSFLAPFYTSRAGLFALNQLTSSAIFGLSGSNTAVTDALDILSESFRLVSNKDVTTDIEYSFSRDWHYGRWQRIFTQINTAELASLGAGYHSSAVLWYCSDLTTANKIMSARLVVSEENQQYAEFEIPPRYHTLELNDLLDVTHMQGLGASGYQAVPFRVTGLEITLMPREAKVRVMAGRNLDDTAHGDSHGDAHGDASHTDGHGDAAASSSHTDTAHSDTTHGDTHNDTAHSDTSHADSHGDSPHSDEHGDVHGDATSGGGPVHADVAADDLCDHLDGVSAGHIDVHCDDHNDTLHSDTVHSDVSHADGAHVDTHSDSGHADSAHGDSHTDTSHSDTPHSDIAHTDTEHNDYHTDDSLAHTDSSGPHGDHSDVHHTDGA